MDLEVLENACDIAIASTIEGMGEKLGNVPSFAQREKQRRCTSITQYQSRPLDVAIQSHITPKSCLASSFSPQTVSGSNPQKNAFRLAT
jgi:hypothetical protein